MTFDNPVSDLVKEKGKIHFFKLESIFHLEFIGPHFSVNESECKEYTSLVPGVVLMPKQFATRGVVVRVSQWLQLHLSIFIVNRD